MHHDRAQAHVLEQYHVARELLAQLGVLHGRTAVLDHDGLGVELPDVGQRLEQRGHVARSAAHVVYSALMRTYSCDRSEK